MDQVEYWCGQCFQEGQYGVVFFVGQGQCDVEQYGCEQYLQDVVFDEGVDQGGWNDVYCEFDQGQFV